jgi:hypothetical protein
MLSPVAFRQQTRETPEEIRCIRQVGDVRHLSGEGANCVGRTSQLRHILLHLINEPRVLGRSLLPLRAATIESEGFVNTWRV